MSTHAPSASPSAYQRIYVWELPVRFYHWLNALCILVLTVTGFLIANPPAINTASEASFSYWFGMNRFIHFAAAYVFVFNFAFRIYWGFVGNKYANWKNFLPLRWTQAKEVGKVLRVDILQSSNTPLVAAGHNALAYLTYFVMFLVFVFQVASGFAMYANMSDAWFPSLFTWMLPLFGGDAGLRQWHHLATWFFIIFTIIHVYLVFYHDYVEGHGVLSSMAGGWKFLPKKHVDGDGKSRFSGQRAAKPAGAAPRSPS
ncbi:MAG TPA: Ni/Fe-hydrogenase, b-type cytochrome subunit [Opitutaceae bacterium]|nr:Ni/Fe-hydrogenase, b-type cytochrome subunit [Opitutaceae bacterium]